jgi:hypothetical protein
MKCFIHKAIVEDLNSIVIIIREEIVKNLRGYREDSRVLLLLVRLEVL